jgi:16S rRNA (guanine1207-N2)-methyltransferase
MNDLAFVLLQLRINDNTSRGRQCLWVVDENINDEEIAGVVPSSVLTVVCNRFDVSNLLKERGFNVLLSDFDFSLFENHRFDCIFYRVSKEKAVVHHIINQSTDFLKEGGALFIGGYKNEGIKTYIDKATQYLGECDERERGGKTSLLAVITKREAVINAPLEDKGYASLRVINPEDTVPLFSKPGLFGWNKIDQGSSYLVKFLPQFFQQLSAPAKRIADLGCGYGYLSVMVNQLTEAELIATDNNVAAVAACQENFKQYSIKGRVLLADCVAGVGEAVDVVICNPPFHQGFAVEADLTLKFLLACKQILRNGGQALFVVNSFIPLERKAASVFSDVSVLDNNKHYKLILLKK